MCWVRLINIINSIITHWFYVSNRGYWNCTILKHFCIAWGEAKGCTVVLKGGTISMPTDRHVDNVFIPSLKTTTDFQFSLIQCIIFKFRKWYTCNYEWYRLYRSYENCRPPGVAILDMQMSKVSIISGYVLLEIHETGGVWHKI
jgi:hypothetical protein